MLTRSVSAVCYLEHVARADLPEADGQSVRRIYGMRRMKDESSNAITSPSISYPKDISGAY